MKNKGWGTLGSISANPHFNAVQSPISSNAYAINVTGRQRSKIQKGKITKTEQGQEKRSTGLLATRMDGVKKRKCVAHFVECCRRLGATVFVFVKL